jgi:hypothetical protein
MFQSIRLFGTTGTILWGEYVPAAELRAWTIRHHRPDRTHDARWTLTATFSRVTNKFALRQRPLHFSAPRAGGYWHWPLEPQSIQVSDTTLQATLGRPVR